MNRYLIEIEIEDGKVEEIMTRLDKAQEEIRKCYDELQNLGILKIFKEKDFK